MKISDKIGLCFDDILLVPKFSNLKSRKEPDISTVLGSNQYNIRLETPIISAPMDSVTSTKMIKAMDSVGGLGILSRYISLSCKEELRLQVRKISEAITSGIKNIGCAIGIKDALEKTERLTDLGCNVVCLDVAHCDHFLAHKTLEKIVNYRSSKNMNFILIAGNVCTRCATKTLINIGVDVVKVGIGPGAACTTRHVTGFGMPQLSAIIDCYDIVTEYKSGNVSLISDGGLRNSGDMVKALWAGADACMIGYMLAGTDCTPDIDGQKVYRGMSSRNVSMRNDIAPEGINIKMDYKGKTIDKLNKFISEMKSGFAMGGASNINQLRENVYANKITSAAIKESMTHDGTDI